VTAFHAGKPLSSIGLAPLIAHVGFPIPVILALWITLNESIGAFLVGVGLLTRFAAASLALGMVGALYTSYALGRRLAESSRLSDHLRRLDFYWRWQVLNQSSAASQKNKLDYASRFRFLIFLAERFATER
jgi:DoxX